MNSSTVYDVRDYNNAVAAVLTLANSSIGLLLNITIIYTFIAYKSQKTSFYVICLFRAVSNTYVLACAFLGVFLPIIVLGHSIYSPIVETILIAIASNCNLFNTFQGIYFSINRFFAFFFPRKYYLFFKIKWTVLFHLAIYAVQIWDVTLEMIYRYENEKYLLFSSRDLAYSGFLKTLEELYVFIGLFVGIPFIVDMLTLTKYYYLRKSLFQTVKNRNEIKRNMIQFLQTVLQYSLFSINVIFNMLLATWIDHRMWTFFCQTFVWQCLHVFDGFLMFMFNEHLSFVKATLFGNIHPARDLASHVAPIS